MLTALRREYGQLITSGAQLLLIIAGVEIDTRDGWLLSFTLMALISVFAWIAVLRRLRLMRDTPTSKIGYAAQGYVELQGRGRPLADPPLLSKLTLLPCLWYRYRVEQKEAGDKWQTEDSGESKDPFILDDGTGRCVIDPGNAEILTSHKDSWQLADRRYTEWKLLGLDTLYAIGQFRTVGGGSEALEANEQVKSVLAAWKLDMPTLNKRFDLNHDGQLDMREWLLARQAAKREAAQQLSEKRAQADTNYLIQPRDGRLFMITNLSQDKIERRYWFWTWAHLAIFFGALVGISRQLSG